MSVVILVGRILFSMIFVGSALGGHLGQTETTAGFAETRGVSNAKLLTQLSGVLILLVGAGIILGVWMDLAALGAAAYVLIANFMVHHFWTDHDEMMKSVEMTNFMKNLAIAGGALVIFAMARIHGADLGFTLTDPLFGTGEL